MKKKKLTGYVLTGALTLGLVGGMGINAFAASGDISSTPIVPQAQNVKAPLNQETRQKAQAILDELKTNLSSIGVELPEKFALGVPFSGFGKGNAFANLDDETKAKVQAIMDQVRAGTITRDEAHTQMQNLGVDFFAGDKFVRGGKGHRGAFGPDKFNEAGPFANLDDETKAKVQAIMDQVRAGTITRDEAHTQMQNLGVDSPAGDKFARGGKGHRGAFGPRGFNEAGPYANLDDETKAKVQAIRDDVRAGNLTHQEAQSKFQELGIEVPVKAHQDLLANLDDETKAKAQAFIDKAKADLAELGINRFPFRRF